MDKIAPFHNLNPHILQNPSLTHNHNHKPHKTHSFTSLAVTHTSPETPLLPSLSCDITTLNSVKAVHAQIIKMSDKPSWDTITMGNSTLITYYLDFGDFNSAAMLFFLGFVRNHLIWNSFLKEFTSFGGDPRRILAVFTDLHCRGVVFDTRLLAVVLKICARLKDLWLGVEIHACLIKRGFVLDLYLNCALINFYGRCGGIESANQVFHEMPDKEDLLWNEVIMENLRNERCVEALDFFRDMNVSIGKINCGTIVKVLQACVKMGALNEGKQIHGYVLRCGLESNLSICNSLISLYSKNDRLELARIVFESMRDRNLSSWNSIISGYAGLGCLNVARDLFHEMEVSGVKPDIITWNCLLSGHSLHGSFKEVVNILQRMQGVGCRPNSSSITSVIKAVIKLGFINFGKEIHGYVTRNALDHDVYVGTSLLDMYVKTNCLTSARAVFNNMKNRNIFAWNSLISGYSYKGLFEDAEKLLNQMEKEGIKPDLVTWNGLVSGYSMWGCSKEALAVIHRIRSSGLTPNVVSWTALISGCSQNESYEASYEFFIQMQEEGIKPNSATISSLLRTCAGLSLLHKGEEIHCLSIKYGVTEDAFVATSLIDMYSKSGKLKNAHEVFRKIQNKTLASWNSMIMGFAIYGFGREVISLFDEMCGVGIQPDSVTFTAVLSGCKNTGLVHEGWKYFDDMSTYYNIIPRIEHYSCMVDLLGRAGYLDEAWDFIQNMAQKPDATIWGALLGSCKIHKNIEYAELAAKKLFELEPYNSGNYVLMMNLYAISNRWEDVERIKASMGVLGVKNFHVWSWIQIDCKIHFFSAEEKPHPDTGEIYFELYNLVSEMKKVGYVPDVSCVYQNIDEVEKEKVLFGHTEKLAITYGLMKMKSSTPIRVIKNTRMCSDCHTAAKYMSLVRNHEIVIKDGVRFHHFRVGNCSCNDCW
uniref:DYW domain-containing protein n=1 Tax=Fagus sylvatica TaxID=28930 RepID=A0A2N9J388_FAGSY